MRDYQQWHRAYDDPGSPLSWRLSVVRRLVADALDRHAGNLRLVSACSGDGRDVLEVLGGRADAPGSPRRSSSCIRRSPRRPAAGPPRPA